MKRILFLILVFCAFEVCSQNISNPYHIGLQFDSKGEMLDGYYDFDTEFKQFFRQKYMVSNDFAPGRCYDLNNNKLTGWIKYSQLNASCNFKLKEDADEYEIDPSNCNSFVAGADSFTVIQNFKTNIDLQIVTIKEKEFVQVIDRIGDFTFYKHINKPAYNSNATLTAKTCYIVKADHWNNSKSFYGNEPKDNELWDSVFTELLGRPSLKTEDFKEDALSMIKKLKYSHKAKQQHKIFFNACWDEVEDSAKSAFNASVFSKGDILHLVYYINGNNIPICEGDFISFYPHVKTGDFIWYYADGKVRKKVLYIKNIAENTYAYHTNGKNHYEFKTLKKKRFYIKVFSNNGVAILDSAGSGTEVYFDSFSNKDITMEYVNHYLVSAYYPGEDGEKVFKYVKKNAYVVEFSSVQSEFKAYKSYPLTSATNNQHGIALVKVIVEPTGYVSDVKIIKSLDASSDTLIQQFFPIFRKNILWHAGTYQKKKVRQEVIVPVEFAICGFSRYRSNSQYYESWSFQLKSVLETKTDMIIIPKLTLPVLE